MTIRERVDTDLPAAVLALRAVHDVSGYPTAWPSDPAGWLTPLGLLRSWVAEAEDMIVGGVAAVAGATDSGLARATGVPADRLVLVSRLYVAPAGRRRGLAKALIDAVIDFAARDGRRVGLDVIETSTDAITLYESLGWAYCGSDRAAWKTQRGEYPVIRYYLAPARPLPTEWS